MASLDLYNKSILAIPAYFVLTWMPHAYAISVASGGNLAKYDNRNPRAAGFLKNLQDTLPPDQYKKYERARAAHVNLMENLPLFASTVILGVVAKSPQAELDSFAATYLALRAVYLLVYVATKSQKYTPIRSVLWTASVAVCFRAIFSAAKSLAV